MAEITATLAHFFQAGQFSGLPGSASSGSHPTTMLVEAWLAMVKRLEWDSGGVF
jgi:hypothetical protein